MRRSPRLLIAAIAVGVLVPTAASQTAVSAVDQDLVVSATSGAPGTEVTVTSASCDTEVVGNTIRFLQVRLISGTAPNEVLAGIGVGVEGQDAILVVPDWIDPAEPAVVEAACVQVSVEEEDAALPPLQTLLDYDPVAFDVEAGPGAPVQARTYSRTSLQAGQAFAVSASGCFLDDASHGYVDVVAGSDLTFRTPAALAFSGEAELEAGSFEVLTALVNGGVNISLAGDDLTPENIEIEEIPTDIPAGTYSSVSYCTRDDGANLLYEPELIEVTGNAPFGDMDLTVPAQSRTATVAGASCTAGDVDALVWGDDFDADYDQALLASRPAGPGPALRPASASPHRTRPTASSVLLGSRSGARSLSDEPLEQIVTPAADGSWSFSADAGFDQGLVGAYAMCGDPLEDGFLYDDRATVVSVFEAAPATASTTTSTTTPSPAPANAVAGTPTYAA